MKTYNYICKNCKNEVPLPEKEFSKAKKQILPKLCRNCEGEARQAPRQTLRPMKPRKK